MILTAAEIDHRMSRSAGLRCYYDADADNLYLMADTGRWGADCENAAEGVTFCADEDGTPLGVVVIGYLRNGLADDRQGFVEVIGEFLSIDGGAIEAALREGIPSATISCLHA